MRLMFYVLVLFLASSATISANVVFAVTGEDIDICGSLSRFGRILADGAEQGRTRESLAGDFHQGFGHAARDDILDIVFSFRPGNPGLASKTIGAICLLERLQPMEVN